jgi:biotin carboxyl carrier protein
MPTRYTAILDGTPREVEVEDLAAGSLRLKIGEDRFEVDVRRVGRSSFSIIIDSQSFDVDVAYDGDGVVLASRGVTTRVTLEDVARRSLRGPIAARAQMTGKAELKAMMPGRVVNVLVKAGDQVEAGQGVIVIEAMKMENELKSPKAGKVIDLKVEAGQTVEKGELLIIIE